MIALLLGVGFFYYLGVWRAKSLIVMLGSKNSINALPRYYGYLSALWFILPALALLLLWSSVEGYFIHRQVIQWLSIELRPTDSDAEKLLFDQLPHLYSRHIDTSPHWVTAQYYHHLQYVSEQWMYWAVLILASLSASWVSWRSRFYRNVRVSTEAIICHLLFICAVIAICTTLGIVLSVLFESIRFFQLVPVTEFLWGTHWSPQASIRDNQIASSGSFGAIPLFVGTLQISFLAMVVAVPVGLMAAIYLSEYAHSKTRDIVKPLLEILAGIPTVVYGFFAVLTIAPLLRKLADSLNIAASSESILVSGLVMGLMIIPFISSLSDDVIKAVPKTLRDASLALGATPSETIRKVVMPAALPGIVSSILLAVSRAIGETMIVVMAAGLIANLTFNPLQSATTVTVQIVTLLVGDQAFDSAKTLAAFALGLILFVVTLGLNIIALSIVKKYREQYE